MSILPSITPTLAANDNAARIIVFEDIDLAVRIGAYASERLKAQRVRISAEVLVLPDTALRADRLDEVVDYDALHRRIVALAEAPHVDLQETLAEAVARICLATPQVAAVEVYVRKLDVYPDCASVGIRILRTRAGSTPAADQHP